MRRPVTRALLAAAAARLAAAGIARAPREARWIAAHLAGVEPGALLSGPPVALDAFHALVARRAAREPLAYVLGHAPFRALRLLTSPATLIPRADSETLIEAALDAVGARDGVGRVLDLGTGTGCLLLAALTEFPGAFGVGIDRSAAACRLAAANAAACGLEDRCAVVCADWAVPIGARFDLILSNPPYIPSAEIPRLMPEVAAHEPRSALDGGADGLAAYHVLLATLPPLLSPGGVAIFEVGAGQSTAVSALAEGLGWSVAVRCDGGGHDRALLLRRA